MSKKIKVGINGFGRIGRNVFRSYVTGSYKCHEEGSGVEIEVVAINDLSNPKSLAHLLKHDSVHGNLTQDVSIAENGDLKVEGKVDVKIYSERNPADIPWSDHDVDVVMDCTGIFRDGKSLKAHMGGSVKKVILSAPGKEIDGTFVMGVNDEEYNKEKHHIVSNASCTTNCLAPLAKAIHEAVGIESGLITTVHAYTADQRLLDADHSDMRRARSAALSMVPTTTGAAAAVGEVLPSLKGKLDGMAIRVPTPNVSVVDATFQVSKDVTEEEIKEAIEKAAKNSHVLAVEKTPLVSIDFNGNTYSSIVDLELTKVLNKRTVKVISWYDNEVGYSTRMLNLASKVL